PRAIIVFETRRRIACAYLPTVIAHHIVSRLRCANDLLLVTPSCHAHANHHRLATPWLPLPLEQLAQTSSRFIAVDFARCHIQHQLLPALPVRRRLNSVQSQEYDRRHHCGSFVSVEKWMVTAKVKEICRCYVDEISVGGLPTER